MVGFHTITTGFHEITTITSFTLRVPIPSQLGVRFRPPPSPPNLYHPLATDKMY